LFWRRERHDIIIAAAVSVKTFGIARQSELFIAAFCAGMAFRRSEAELISGAIVSFDMGEIIPA